MTESIKILRADIAEILFNTDDLHVLKAIYANLIASKNQSEKQDSPLFMEAVRPIKPELPLDEIIRTQKYTPISYSNYRKRVDGIQWTQSLDELLAALN
jgi:hypothetical protein